MRCGRSRDTLNEQAVEDAVDLSKYQWHVSGYTPHGWRAGRTTEEAIDVIPEVPDVPVRIPGSVNGALREAGILPDWNTNLDSRACEWVEHRDWVFSTTIPRRDFRHGRPLWLRCRGLDGYGRVLFNNKQVGTFRNGYVPHDFDLRGVEICEENVIEIIFEDLPRYLGSPALSSQIRDLKARFNYNWDWMPRNVQIGIWDAVTIQCGNEIDVDDVLIATDYNIDTRLGGLTFRCPRVGPAQSVLVEIEGVVTRAYSIDEAAGGVRLDDLPVEPWFCNGLGGQRLYKLHIRWLDAGGDPCAVRELRVGFKHVAWRKCRPSPGGADPWLCVLNGKEVFQVGVNWTPIRAHFADVTEADYRKRLQAYRDIGFNVLRVWGGAFLEKEVFYRLCDEMGFMIWQEFPLSSSGPDNQPPDDPETVRVFSDVARSYVRRRRHHVSLLLWSGGNELMTAHDGSPGGGKPLTLDHPMLAALGEVCAQEDPGRRYIPTSPSGPRFSADADEFGRGLHWDVHGPWRVPGGSIATARAYWADDDALFRSETGAPSCSPMSILEAYYPIDQLSTISADNPYWRRCHLWIDTAGYAADHGHPPDSLASYVEWSQAHQSEALLLALDSALRRFPAIGGMIFWMGHDAFPCVANTSLLDFHGDPKPAAIAIRQRLERFSFETTDSGTAAGSSIT